ncbi:lysozyme inhibitor LprI family protein [Dongia sp.]|uniref:lysozyme inhibitor LprI family protein n=1 Tax=Dongia sp. TaxID=1977262 RepID=UPI0035ADE070
MRYRRYQLGRAIFRTLPHLLIAMASISVAHAEDAVPGACLPDYSESTLGKMISNRESESGFSRNSRIGECQGNQLEMSYCINYKYLVSESEMRLALKSLNAMLSDSPASQALLRSQGDWCSRRDKSCDEVAANFEGGSAKGSFLDDCLIKHNRGRTDQLLDALARVRDRADVETLNTILSAP